MTAAVSKASLPNLEWPARPRANALDLSADGNVVDVRAIPGQQNLHPMHGRHRDVRSVHFGFGGNQAPPENLGGEFAGGFRRRQARQTLHRRSAGHRHPGISAPYSEVHKITR
jgi:hypothetical protein